MDADRRRHLDEVFGDVLPERTRDELDEGPDRVPLRDGELLEDRPPHHDRDP